MSEGTTTIEKRHEIMSEAAERIRTLLLAHGIDTEAADDPVAVGFGLGEILGGLVHGVHALGACNLERLMRADAGKATPVQLVANTVRHVGQLLGETESPAWWDSACLNAAAELEDLESRIDRFAYWSRAEGHDCGQFMSFEKDDTCALCDLISGFGELPEEHPTAPEEDKAR